jgi:hypothetical protein
MNDNKRHELAQQIVCVLKKKDLLEREAVSILRESISIIDEISSEHKLH